MAAVAFSTNTRSSPSAPTKRASSPAAFRSTGGSTSRRKWSGFASIRSRQAAAASSTSIGAAPKEPWLMKSTPGSSRNLRRSARPSSGIAGV